MLLLNSGNTTFHSNQVCTVTTDGQEQQFHYSDSMEQVCPQSLKVFGDNPKFHLQKAVAVGNLYRLLLGPEYPSYRFAYDTTKQRYYRLSTLIADAQLWPDTIVDSEEEVLIAGCRLDELNHRMFDAHRYYDFQHLISVGLAAILLADVDVNPSNLMLLKKSKLTVIKVDPECGFSYQLLQSVEYMLKCLYTFPKHDVGQDYYESIVDDFDDKENVINFLFSEQKIKNERAQFSRQFISRPFKVYADLIDEAISDEFMLQKKVIIESMLNRYRAIKEQCLKYQALPLREIKQKNLIIGPQEKRARTCSSSNGYDTENKPISSFI